jgi:putative hydrolase of the HAD superfamily
MSDYKVKAIIFDWGDTLMRDFNQYDGPMVKWPHVETMPGVEDALTLIYKDYTCCVASNAGASDSKMMSEALERVGIRSFFKWFFTSKELGATKPDIKFFQGILNTLNLRPEEVIMVGNDYEKDIKPAKTIGMGTILYSETYTKDSTPSADFIIDSMEELYLTILRLN